MKRKVAKKGGRKKADDPKEVISVWVNKSMIETVGGKEMAKVIAKDAIRLDSNRVVAAIALGEKYLLYNGEKP